MTVEDYLSALTVPLLSKPEALKITKSEDQLGQLLTMTVHKDDMGVLIGKAGETAKAVRHLVRIAGVKHNARVSVRINEPDGSQHKPKKAVVSSRELIA